MRFLIIFSGKYSCISNYQYFQFSHFLTLEGFLGILVLAYFLFYFSAPSAFLWHAHNFQGRSAEHWSGAENGAERAEKSRERSGAVSGSRKKQAERGGGGGRGAGVGR